MKLSISFYPWFFCVSAIILPVGTLDNSEAMPNTVKVKNGGQMKIAMDIFSIKMRKINQRKNPRFLIVFLLVGVAIGYFACLYSPVVKPLLDWRKSNQDYIYDKLETASDKLRIFIKTEEIQDLIASKESLDQMLLRIDSCDTYTGYLRDTDNISVLVLNTSIHFMETAANYMDQCIDATELSPHQIEILKSISEVMNFKELGVTFGAVYLNLGNAPFPYAVVE